MRQFLAQIAGVAPADIEMVEAHDLAQDVDDLGDALVPRLFALLPASGVADVFVIGLSAADRMVGEFEMRHDFAVAKDCRAGPGPEGQDHLDAVALDRAKSLDIGVVQNPDWLAPMVAQRLLQVEAGQGFGPEIGCRQQPSVAHIAGETNRDAVERAERCCDVVDRLDQGIRSDRFGRGRHALPLADHGAGRVEQRGLDAGAADIDRKRASLVHRPSSARAFWAGRR